MEQHFFIQKSSSYPVILGQPYITSSRMETKVLEDGSSYARIRRCLKMARHMLEMGILEPSDAPYSNKWFTVPKKNGSLRLI